MVPAIAVTVVPAVTPATSTMSPTETFVFASTTICVCPIASAPFNKTCAPNPSPSTKLISPPTTVAVALALNVTDVPVIAATVVFAAIPVP